MPSLPHPFAALAAILLLAACSGGGGGSGGNGNASPLAGATPRAVCGPGSTPETGLQGQVSLADHESGRAAAGFMCNTTMIGYYGTENPISEDPYGTVGGFKVERYKDASGNDCAYYDTTLLWPTNIADAMAGVNVMDMSDPAAPAKTAQLVTPAMLSPHESVVLSTQRGVLAAVFGNPGAYPGIVDVYDVSGDCREPVLKASAPVGVLGHESGMAPDGLTFYSAMPGSPTLTPVDIENLMVPVPLAVLPVTSHGLSISDDGNRAYIAGGGADEGLVILDTSQIQARVANPVVPVISRLTWPEISIPQNAIPVTIKGKPYVVEIDEYGGGSKVGAGRIIDISDETQPKVISNLRLEVHEPENFDAIAADPGAGNPVGDYAGHYCNVPTRVDPAIVACSMIVSGLRIFDIRDPHRPKEVAYFVAPVHPRLVEQPAAASNWAMSSPAFVPERKEIWYSDGYNGFYTVRVTNGAWPD